ncbi:MAG: hypothetical protein H6729_02590 [Deltaproteobacteria bacterium]|nr:hypothetical protein [Deltaproteobacteria bacterium]
MTPSTITLAFSLGLVTLTALSTGGCGNDNGGPIGGGQAQEVCPEPTFSSIYSEILSQPTCAAAGCHSGGRPAAGMSFSKTQAEALAQLHEPTTSSSGGATYPNRVVPGQPSESFLLQRIATATITGGLMPPSGAPLPTCAVSAVRSWIADGALDN